jgi:hypothetical protein
MSRDEIKTQAALARAIGRSRSAIRKWIADPRWLWPRVPPWLRSDVPAMQAWATANLQEDRAAGHGKTGESVVPSEASARSVLTAEKAALARLERMEQEGRLHDVDACRSRRVRQVHMTKNALYSMCRDAAPGLVGLGKDEIEAELRKCVDRICSEFSGVRGT